MKRKELWAGLVIAVCLAMAGCGTQGQDGTASGITGEPISIQEDVSGQSGKQSAANQQETASGDNGKQSSESRQETQGNAEIVAGYEGMYVETIAGRGVIYLTRQGDGTYEVKISWPDSAFETVTWCFHGSFDDNAIMNYKDCVRETTTFDENGNDSSVTNYENGTGRLYFADGYMHWDDGMEHVADDSLFAKDDFSGGGADSVDPNYYSGVTWLEREIVEAFAENARDAYLEQDWEMIVDLIRYPITMYPNEKINNREEFLAYVKGKTISESDLEQMRNETCKDMFFNGEGICMGSGQIWFYDENYMTDQSPQLRITAISGLSD